MASTGRGIAPEDKLKYGEQIIQIQNTHTTLVGGMGGFKNIILKTMFTANQYMTT